MTPAGRGAGLLALVAIAAGLGLAGMSACENDPLYAYQGYRHDPVRGCNGPANVLDVLVGTRKDDCELVCLVGTVGDGATELYVSSDCPPYPRGYTLSDSERYCAEAKAAFARGDRCLADGGQTNPPVDAGPDADASAGIDSGNMDAAPDAPADAAGDAAGDAPADAPSDAPVDTGAD